VRNHNDDDEDRKRVRSCRTTQRRLHNALAPACATTSEHGELESGSSGRKLLCPFAETALRISPPEPDAGQHVQSSSSVCWVRRRTSPGLIPAPANTVPATSATASASSPSCTGTLFRTNSTARCLSASYARKFRTKHGFPSESKVVTRTFQPAGILATYAPHFRDVKTRCVIIVSGTAGDVFRLRDCHNHL
jgi:hypothetical protein